MSTVDAYRLYQDPELGTSFNVRVFHLKVSISLEDTGQSIVRGCRLFEDWKILKSLTNDLRQSVLIRGS